MSTEELLFIKNQVECSHPACHLHDFLPVKCPGCRLPFCTLHHSPFPTSAINSHSHPCPSPPPDRTPIPCPICALPVGTPPGGDANQTMDAHMGSAKCDARREEVGREREVLRGRKERGEVCWKVGCKRGLMGGLGVRCDACPHTFCPTHRFPSSHSCSSTPTASGSRTPTPAPQPKGIRAALGGPSREAALAAIKRQGSSTTPTTAKPKAPEPTPLKPKEKDVNPNDKKSGGLKPLQNPLSATSRHSKSELASRKKALAHRAKLGLLTPEEQLVWAEMAGVDESSRRRREEGGGGGKKKDGCVVG